MTLPAILIGAGGHARVVSGMAEALNMLVIGLCDPLLADKGQPLWNGIPVLGADTALDDYDPSQHVLLNGTGMLPGVNIRQNIHQRLGKQGWQFASLVHPAAWVASDVVLGSGVQIMAGAIVQSGTVLEDAVILNTNASVDHDCTIGQHSHIAPGATLCGAIKVGRDVFIGAGSTVLSGLSLGNGAVIAAGSTITSNVAPGATCFGRFGQGSIV
jgi:UDP-perosamine 4-acetyltransferase